MPYGIIKVDQVTFTNAGVDQTISVSGIVASISGNITATGTISGDVIRGGTLVSGATVTGTAGQFGTITGNTAGFTTVTGTTITGTTLTVASGTFTGNSTAAAFIPTGSTVPTNGVYLPSANNVAISTNGANRFQIDSSGNITVDTNTFYVDAANNRVGVGTTSPSNALHVVSPSVQALFEGSNQGNIAIQKAGTSGMALYSDGAGRLAFYDNAASSERMRIDSSGRVGIGTSSPSNTAGFIQQLELAGSIPCITINQTDAGFTLRKYSIGLNTVGSLGVWDNTASAYRMMVTSAGNVGIGTTGPQGLLHLQQSLSDSVPILALGEASNNVRYSIIQETGYTGISHGNTNIDLKFKTFANAGSGGAISFWTGSTSASERARLDSSGRLLVGTSSTSATSTAVFASRSDAAAAPLLAFHTTESTVTNGANFATLSFGNTATTGTNAAAFIQAQRDGGTWTNNSSMPGRLVFSTTADGASSPTERMRITSGGTMLQGNTSDLTGVLGTGLKVKSNDVGTSYSAAALCLQGTGGDFYAIKFADGDMGVLSVTSGGVDYISIGGSATTATFFSNGLIQLPNVGTTASAANVFMDSTAGNQLARSTSSLRYKTDIEDLDTDRADAALSLRPVWYRSKATADRKDWSHYGLIAEEVAEIEPRLVNWTYLEDDYITVTNEYGIENKELKPNAKLVPDGVQYDRLPVLLLSVVQRQEKRIKQLEAEIAAVKAQLS